jgi:hypothetical protein
LKTIGHGNPDNNLDHIVLHFSRLILFLKFYILPSLQVYLRYDIPPCLMEQIYIIRRFHRRKKTSLKSVMSSVLAEILFLSDFVFSTRTLRIEVIVEGLVFGFRLC